MCLFLYTRLTKLLSSDIKRLANLKWSPDQNSTHVQSQDFLLVLCTVCYCDYVAIVLYLYMAPLTALTGPAIIIWLINNE
jgi:hypothetical protein